MGDKGQRLTDNWGLTAMGVVGFGAGDSVLSFKQSPDFIAIATFIIAVLALIIALLSWLPIPRQQYRMRLFLRIVRPRFSLQFQQRCHVHPTNLVGRTDQYIRFHGLQLQYQENPPSEYNVRLEIREPTNRWTCRWVTGALSLINWNEEQQPTPRNPRIVQWEVIQRMSGVNIGCIGINHDKTNPREEDLEYKFTCLGATIVRGKILVP